MAECPKCRTKLINQPSGYGLVFACPRCGGLAASIDALRKADIDTLFLTSLWTRAHEPDTPRHRPCPHCGRPMAEVGGNLNGKAYFLDVCTLCHAMWFDPAENDQVLPDKIFKDDSQLTEKQKNALMEIELEANRERYLLENDDANASTSGLITRLGLPVLESEDSGYLFPIVTWGLAGLIGLISLMSIFEIRLSVAQHGFIPELWNRHGGFTIFGSMLLHSNPFTTIINILFLLALGESLEEKIGCIKLFCLFMSAHFSAILLYWVILPHSSVPLFGATAGIAGLFGYIVVAYPVSTFALIPSVRFWGMVISPLIRIRSIKPIYLLALYGLLLLIIARYRFDENGYLALLHIAGLITGIVAGLWHRAAENEKKPQSSKL